MARNGNGTKNKVDIAVLKEKTMKNEEFIDKIMNNHLPHIESRLDSIEKKMAYYAGSLAVIIIVVHYFGRF